jgi:hypothetical protein
MAVTPRSGGDARVKFRFGFLAGLTGVSLLALACVTTVDPPRRMDAPTDPDRDDVGPPPEPDASVPPRRPVGDDAGPSTPAPRAGSDAAADAMPPTAQRTPTALACNAERPAGAAAPPPWPTFAGTCPKLVPAPAENTITSTGAARRFMVAMPKAVREGERLPVIFLWHWLGGSANIFYQIGDVQSAVDQLRFVAVIPEAKGDLPFKWPFNVLDAQPRLDEEFAFFDDMLACVGEAFPTANHDCVASVGVSAGALFTDQLAAGRAQYLASVLSLSGGTGGVIRPWGKPARKVPMLVSWGGPIDFCVVIDFETTSHDLEDALTSEGNFVLECVHNCGHAPPPFTPPMGVTTYEPLWQFAFDHQYWL